MLDILSSKLIIKGLTGIFYLNIALIDSSNGLVITSGNIVFLEAIYSAIFSNDEYGLSSINSLILLLNIKFWLSMIDTAPIERPHKI